MGALRHPHHHLHFLKLSAVTALAFLLFASQLGALDRVVDREKPSVASDRVLGSEKRLAGPGSSPPTCRSKCGRCFPCKPVHVPIQPGLSIPLEYYPEAWRCKCGNKLFMP